MKLIIQKNTEIFNFLSFYTISLNGKKEKLFLRKEIEIKEGENILIISNGLFKSNELKFNLDNSVSQTYFVKVNGSSFGRHGRFLSTLCLYNLIIFCLNLYVIKSSILDYFLFIPYFIYLLMPVYTSIFESKRNRLELILTKSI